MQSYTFPVCRQCRLALSRQFHSSPSTARTVKPLKRKRTGNLMISGGASALQPAYLPRAHSSAKPQFSKTYSIKPPKRLNPEQIRIVLRRNLPEWTEAPQTLRRLTTLSFEENEAQAFLGAYEHYMEDQLSLPLGSSNINTHKDPWGVSHLFTDDNSKIHALIDRALTLRLFDFAAQPGLEIEGVSAESLLVLKEAHEALDMRYPAEAFPIARAQTRKVYLHVGPTNSGKTYNALCALASARSGVYAGPLRLLAHEVWERLNRGSIRPFDADPATAHMYARECNLLTGEEQRIVSPDAGLTSCTVEMINLFKHWSVCVIDEIQMIADPQRGNSWTAAVLGVCADEVHLCGEEAAVPLIEALMKETGDELIIKHYQRLTPLAVAEKSLEGRWDRVEKGDCIVTFSRASIFALKRLVEQSTGLRCAVAYGRLPPETRSEQAALFNDQDSGYDVMVASDAIGMGLNLKIKRIVFVQLTKYNGVREVPLSLSQIKQIGGRAGRFGERGDSSSIGIVTSLNKSDLPILTKAFAMDAPVLRRAIIPMHLAILTRVAQLLPESFGLKELNSLIHVASRLGDNYSLPDDPSIWKGMEVIDSLGKDLRLVEKTRFLVCPTSWRSDEEVEVFGQYLQRFALDKRVDIRECLKQSGLLLTLETVNKVRKANHPSLQLKVGREHVQTKETLATMETLHKVLVTYIWLAFRMPVSFCHYVEAAQLKEEVEMGIEFILEGIGSVKGPIKRLELREENPERKIEYASRRVRVPLKIQRANLL